MESTPRRIARWVEENPYTTLWVAVMVAVGVVMQVVSLFL